MEESQTALKCESLLLVGVTDMTSQAPSGPPFGQSSPTLGIGPPLVEVVLDTRLNPENWFGLFRGSALTDASIFVVLVWVTECVLLHLYG